MDLTISLSSVLSSGSFFYRLWKDGVFFKLINYLKSRKTDFNTDYWSAAERKQRQLFSLSNKIQRYFSLRLHGATFISWKDWFELMCGLKYSLEHARNIDHHQINYLHGNLIGPASGDGMDGLLDRIGYLITTFPTEGKEVPNGIIELLMRNFSFCQRTEVAQYHKHELDEIKNALRPLQMIMLNHRKN
jgi:hypothetical protein